MKEPEVCIGLINPKNPDNVGSVLRAAGNFGVGRVFYTGQRYPLAVQRNPAAPNTGRKVSQDIPISGVTCLVDNVPAHMKIVCVEFAENAIALPGYRHPQDAFYIFGPEDGGIGQELIDRADAVVYVPTNGCMNLAATVNVVLYDRLTKSSQSFAGNERIRDSRDTNNRLKVKITAATRGQSS
jgi:tRNA(Leu) C34 or U34 (ribose-2'-O)-methylase TrmL